MKKMTTKAKAFNTKKANAGHDKQKARKVHKQKLILQLAAKERYYRRTRGGEETIVL
tara:strand:+ start:29808 stop:29978 length:171 start_codon:yes stop_codon:yes gene_type:complete